MQAACSTKSPAHQRRLTLASFLFIPMVKFEVGVIGVNSTQNKRSHRGHVSDLCMAELD